MTLKIKPTHALIKPVWRLRRKLRHITKNIYQSLRQNPGPPQAIFIVGSGRSGTDILTHIVSTSYDVRLYNEDNPAAFNNWRFKNLNVIDDLISTSKSRLIVFKPIVETWKAKYFLTRYSNSKVLFISRHPSSTIQSMAKFFGNSHIDTVREWVSNDFRDFKELPDYIKSLISNSASKDMSLLDACALYWLVYNSSYRTLGLHLEKNAMLTTYESIMEEPGKAIDNICQFVDIDFKKSMLANISPSSTKINEIPNVSEEIYSMCIKEWNCLQNLMHEEN